MKVIVVVYEDEEWKQDTLTARMVDTRVEQMVAEFTYNSVPIEVIRHEEVGKWDDIITFARDILEIDLTQDQEEILRKSRGKLRLNIMRGSPEEAMAAFEELMRRSMTPKLRENMRKAFEQFMKQIEEKELTVVDIQPELHFNVTEIDYGRSLRFYVEYEVPEVE